MKNCPFCGSPAYIHVISVDPPMYVVRCSDSYSCQCEVGPFGTEEEAVEKWNRREE